MTDYEKARDEARIVYVKELAKKLNLGREPTEAEFKTMGRPPWDAGADWGTETEKAKIAIIVDELGRIMALPKKDQSLVNAFGQIRSIVSAIIEKYKAQE